MSAQLRNSFVEQAEIRLAKKIKERESGLRLGTVSKSSFESAKAEVLYFMEEGEGWKKARPIHFVALYELFHESVYKVSLAEATPTLRRFMSFAAAGLLKRVFENDRCAMAEYMRWVWTDQARKQKTQDSSWRIGWRLMFSGQLVTDYRMYMRKQCQRSL